MIRRARGILVIMLLLLLCGTLSTEAFAADLPETEEELIVSLREFATAEYSRDDEALLNAYAEQELQRAVPRSSLMEVPKNVGDRFTGAQRELYEGLKTLVSETAAGTRTNTVFVVDLSTSEYSWTASELGYEEFPIGDQEELIRILEAVEKECGISPVQTILNALLMDCPYELYWFDKTQGLSSAPEFGVTRNRIRLKSVTCSFAVAEEYAAGDYEVRSDYGETIHAAVTRAQTIVEGSAGMSDTERLRHFLQEVCSLTDYNTDTSDLSYGNPWQLIWVFDGDPSTTVVCEGYAKAFQYLCDLCGADSAITCISVSGNVSVNGGAAGRHMWNIVTTADGRNRMVDATNCDSGQIGYPDLLFMKQPESGNVYEGYTFRCSGSRMLYFYDEESWSVLSEEELSLYQEFRFIDVTDPADYFYDPVYWALARGITTGRTATTFDPYANCTRAQIVTFLWRYYGEPQVSRENPFTDVKESDYFYMPVMWALENGITTGRTATTFDPYASCTRAQCVTFLWRAAGEPPPGPAAGFTDVQADDYFTDAVSWAYNNGITTGRTATRFDPYAACMRAQVVTFLYRAAFNL